MTNNKGPNTLPCGIPLVTSDHSEYESLTFTLCFLPDRKFSVHLIIESSIPYAWSLDNNLLCGTLSNAFIKSKYTASIFPPSFLISDHLSSACKSWYVVERPFIKTKLTFAE